MPHSLTLKWLFTLGRLEGVSFLALLGIAMPLKYLAGNQHVVPWVGWIHGLLFVLFVIALGSAFRTEGWSLRRLAGGMIASMLPLGTFVFEAAVRRGHSPRAGE